MDEYKGNQDTRRGREREREKERERERERLTCCSILYLYSSVITVYLHKGSTIIPTHEKLIKFSEIKETSDKIKYKYRPLSY